MPSNQLAEELLEEPESRREVPNHRKFLGHWKLALATSLFLWSVYELYAGTITEDFSRPAKIIAIMIFALPGFVFIYIWAVERFGVTSCLVNAPEVDRILARHAGRLGRSGDSRQVLNLLHNYSIVQLTGESGVGKTSFVRCGLTEALETESNASVLIIDNLGESFGESEDDALRNALKRKFGEEIDSSRRANATTLLEGLLKQPVVLVFDEFNSYLTYHRSQLLDTELGIWKSPESITEINKFWKKLFELNKRGNPDLIFVVRSDEADGLSCFSTNRHIAKPLARMELGLFLSVFDEIGDSCVQNRRASYDRLVDMLIEDLSQSRGYILPVEAALAITSLKTRRDLSVSSYLRGGGLKGLIGRRLVNDVDKARSGLFSHEDAFKILEQMIPSREGAGDFSAEEIEQRVTENAAVQLPAEKIATFLGLLEKENITRRVIRVANDPVAENQGGVAWRFYHSYVRDGISALVAKQGGFEHRITKLVGEYSKSPGWVRWNALAPPLLWFQIFAGWLAGRLRVKGLGRYLSHSTLRFGPWLVFPMAVLGAADLGMNFPGSSSLRWKLDQAGFSLVRRADWKKTAETTNELQEKCLAFLKQRFVGPGFVGNESQEQQVLDCWTTFQTIACMARTSAATGENRQELLDCFRRCFDADFVIEVNGEFRGWSQFVYDDPNEKQTRFKEAESMPRGEIPCWALLAAVRLARQATAEERNELSGFAERISKALSRHYQGSGAWNRYDDQLVKSDHSVYVSCLALLALLEAQRAGLAISFDGETTESVINATANWLLNKRQENGGFPGWNDQVDSESSNSLALSLNVYSVILKVDSVSPLAVDDAFQLVRLCWTSGFEAQDISKRQQMSNNPWGYLKGAEYPLTFLTYPWLVESVCELLRQPKLITQADQRVLRSYLTELVVEKGEKNLTGLIGRDYLTYRVSEFLHCLHLPRQMAEERQ